MSALKEVYRVRTVHACAADKLQSPPGWTETRSIREPLVTWLVDQHKPIPWRVQAFGVVKIGEFSRFEHASAFRRRRVRCCDLETILGQHSAVAR